MHVRRLIRPALVVAAIALLGVAGALHALLGAPASAAVGAFNEFPLLTANSVPEGIAAGPDGNLWFAEAAGGTGTQIGRITPTGTVTEFAGLAAGSGPFWITAGPDGNMWFTESSGNRIGRITTSGTVTEFPVPTASSGPDQIAVGPDGNLWFTEFSKDKIAKIDTSGSITEVTTLAAGSGPTGIVAGPDKNLWFDEQKAGKIGMMTTAGVVTEFALAPNSTPSSITKGPDDNLWFTEFDANKIGKITTAGSISEYAVTTVGSQPGTITAGPDGNLWFSEQNANNIGRITPTGVITEFGPIPTSASGPGGITAGADGNMWFTERLGNKIGRLALAAPAACDNVWTGNGGNSNFSDGANWSAGHVPTSTENTCIDATTTTLPKAVADSYTVVVNSNVSVGSLTLGGLTGPQTLDIPSGGISFGINGDSRINANGVLTLGDVASNFAELSGIGHTLTNAGHLTTVAGSGVDTNRYIRANIVNTDGGTIDLAGATVQDGMGGATITTNSGTVTVEPSGSLLIGGGSSFTNAAGSVNNKGAVNVVAGTYVQRAGGGNNNPIQIGDSGILDDSISAGSSLFTLGNNSTLTGPGANAGISGSQTVTLAGGNSSIGLGANVSNLGTIIVGDGGAGSTTVNGNGHLLSSNGNLDTVLGSGGGDTNRYLRLNLINGSGARMDIAGGTVQDGMGGSTTTTNFGTVTVEATGSFALSGGSSFVNMTGSVNNGGSFSLGGGSRFVQRSATVTGNDVVIGNLDVLDSDVSSGAAGFKLENNSTLTGTASNPGIATGEKVTLAAGNASISLGTNFTNAGTITMGDGTPGSTTLMGNGFSLTNIGTLDATQGLGPGDSRFLRASVTNAPGGSIDLFGGTVQDGLGGANLLTNGGTLTIGENGSLYLGGGSAFVQSTGGTLDVTIDGSTASFGRILGGGVLLDGTLRITTIGKPAGGSTWPIISGTALSGIFAAYDFGATNYIHLYSATGLTLAVGDPSISATAPPVSATEGNVFTGTVATFADPDASAAPAEYTATISWGDSTTSSGTITGSGGAFVVSGTHTYAEEGSYPITVTVIDADFATNSATAATTATVADASLTANAATINASEGALTGTVTVAMFTDADGGALPTDYSVTIDWGDGTPNSSGAVTGTGPFTVAGNHAYTEEGAFPVVVAIADVGSAAVVDSTATVADPPVAGTGGLTVSAMEGTPSGIQPVATFVDPGGPEAVVNYSAAIDWGDGTASSAGTITMNPGTDVYSVSGAHQYSEEGTYAVTVTLQHESSGPAVVVSSAVVADPAVVVRPGAVSGVEGTDTGPVTVATFTDPGGPEALGDYPASIDWGDGSTSSGTVTFDAGSKTFTVTGAHVYGEEGSYAAVVTVSHDNASPAAAHLAATIADAPLTATGATVNALEGLSSVSVSVATFNDADLTGTASDYMATIDWGDGSSSVGTVTGPAPFSVAGSHTYAEEGTYATTVVITDAGGSSSTVTGSATVTDPSVAATGGFVLTATEGAGSTSQVVARFTDPGGAEVAGNYSAMINWGDGSTTSGTISGDGSAGVFSVTGAHQYAEEGTYALAVTIQHDLSVPVVANSSATVFDPAVVVAPGAVSGVEGIDTGPVVVATFTDPGGAEALTDYSANIAWGDTTSSAGTISFDTNLHAFTVTGSHRYAEEGPFSIAVMVSHDNAPSATGQTPASITDAPLTAVGATNTALEGSSTGAVSVAAFSDADSAGTASDYTATINWGDGTPSSSGVVSGSGPFSVTGSHTYAEEGTYVTSVVIGDSGGSSTTVSGSSIVSDPAVLAIGGTLSATEGTLSGAQAVATFTDPGGPELPANYSATINWGDGSTSTGSITLDGTTPIFTVTGAHLFTEERSRSFSVSIDHEGIITTVSGSATVADPAVLLTPLPVSGVEGAGTGSVTVATLTDPGGAEALTDYTASIAWGDNTSSAGTITFDANSKMFTVAGDHTYSEEGSFPIAVTVTHDSAPNVTGQQTATIADAPIAAIGVAIQTTEATPFSGSVASFSDADHGGTASDYTATIIWGDGMTTIGTVTGGASPFSVVGTHAYAEEGTYAVSVTIDDAGGSFAMASSSANVSDPPVIATGGFTLIATEGAMSTGLTVATFMDPGGAEPATNYAATINWGDSVSSPGTITADSATGVYTVTGAHQYVEEGAYTVTITISHEAATVSSVTSSANVVDPAALITPFAFTGVEGIDSGSVLVATFTDPGGPEVVTDYAASISWGDGTTTTPGAISVDGAGTFSVTGHHTYAEEGSYTVVVTVAHDSAPPAVGQQTATIAAAALTAAGVAVSATEGAPFSAKVATFTDVNPGALASDFTVTIDWGDGTPASPGTVAANGAGFDVNGNHQYAEEGAYVITVGIADTGGSTAVAISAASVSDATLTATGTTLTVQRKDRFTAVVATFTDADPDGTVSDYSAIIDWGDGTSSAATIAANSAGGFDVTGTHRYKKKGTRTVSVIISDAGGSLATAQTTIKVVHRDDEDDQGDDDGREGGSLDD